MTILKSFDSVGLMEVKSQNGPERGLGKPLGSVDLRNDSSMQKAQMGDDCKASDISLGSPKTSILSKVNIISGAPRSRFEDQDEIQRFSMGLNSTNSRFDIFPTKKGEEYQGFFWKRNSERGFWI